MSTCPRCHQTVESRAIVCPHCRMTLKAHGHPGIPLYRATEDRPLCASCAYDADDTCTFPKRPNAMDCTLYRDVNQPVAITSRSGYRMGFRVQGWLRRNTGLLAVIGLILISLAIVLVR
ncbi:MAG: zinc ribbon domain-containing protein [Leptolyngbyaceae cyanobacterium]